MNTAKGHITTPEGIVSVEYAKENGKATVKVFADEAIEAVFEYKNFSSTFSGKAEFTVEI